VAVQIAAETLKHNAARCRKQKLNRKDAKDAKKNTKTEQLHELTWKENPKDRMGNIKEYLEQR